MDPIFEDDHLLVINKKPGFIVEGPARNGLESLSTILSSKLGKPVHACHRLDKDTTGVVVFAKNKAALSAISEQFARRQVRKTYLVCVDGEWDKGWNRVQTKILRTDEQQMANSTEGKDSTTTFRRLAFWNKRSLLEALPKTGRTHQIRLHCLFHGCPVSGDGLYGSRTEDQPSMALHASQLRIQHPVSKASLLITAPLPDYWHTHWLKDCPLEIG
ncbi:MAG: RluA family pseudouridine synthase [Verrucomicrobia bacterium]|nr:RluA family pseudouridine synthase [Verrucomicrobiota bacterium]MDA1065786.1 RluA family pseudouridine synthase [Verrucomicrobiota bacterium]